MLKKTRLFLALALILTVCFASASAVFATEGPIVQGTPAAPAKAAIAKVLETPVGTTIPAATFNFVAAPVSVDGVAADSASPAMPTIPAANLSVTYPDTTNAITSTSGDTTTSALETGNIFANVPWTHAGVYIYDITEQSDTYQPAVDDPAHETMTYSDASYQVSAYVADDGSGNFYVAYIVDVVTVTDNGDQNNGDKVDPTPGGNTVTGTGYSDMTFTNTYVKTNGKDDPGNSNSNDPTYPGTSTLTVSKMVTGALASQQQLFDFSLTLSVPSLVTPTPASYTAYIVDTTVTPNTASAAITVPVSGYDFQLKHGQELVFVDTPVGTGYTVTENDPTNYEPSYTVTTAGTQTDSDSAAVSTTLGTNPALVGDAPSATDTAVNVAAFLNTRDLVTPTGLSMNELPFVGLILLMAGALVAFIVVKSRKREHYSK